MTSLVRHVIKWGDWPFPKDRVVTLHWIKSPFMEPVSRQWRTNAVFLNGSELKDVEVPWGAFPLLRCGHNYRDGLPLQNTTSASKIIDLRHEPTASIEEAGSVIPPYLLSLQTRKNLAEKCWVFSSANGQQMIIPIVEGIRTLIAPTRFLALHCLDPVFLGEVVRNYSLNGEKFSIEFTDEIPLSALTDGMVVHLVRLLLQPDYRAAWDAIYFSLRKPGVARSSFPKVNLPMPKLKRIVVRGRTAGDTFLVREIVRPEFPFLPLAEIIWSHLRLEKEGETRESKWRRVRVPDKELEMDRSAAASDGTPLRLNTFPSFGSQYIKIHRFAASERTRTRWKQIAGPKLGFALSLGDVGAGVQCPAADIVLEQPMPGTCSTPQLEDGLDDFISALRWLQKLYNGLVSVSVIDCPSDIAFFRIDDRKRKVANAHLIWPTGQSVTIVEFGRPDSHPISTLIFKEGLKDDRLYIFFQCALLSNGSWNRKALSDELGDGNFYLLRHGQRLPDHWARLLLTRAEEVSG
jgi:hypothetical protein